MSSARIQREVRRRKRRRRVEGVLFTLLGVMFLCSPVLVYTACFVYNNAKSGRPWFENYMAPPPRQPIVIEIIHR